jgi:hypothetical protein
MSRFWPILPIKWVMTIKPWIVLLLLISTPGLHLAIAGDPPPFFPPGGIGSPEDSSGPGSDPAPAPPPKPPSELKPGQTLLPDVPPHSSCVAHELEISLRVMGELPAKRFPPNAQYPNPSKWGWYSIRNKAIAFFRKGLRRPLPVWMYETKIPGQASFFAQKELGLLVPKSPEQAVILQEAEQNLKRVIAEGFNYPNRLRELLDKRQEAILRIKEIEEEVATLKSKKTPIMDKPVTQDLSVVTDGKADPVDQRITYEHLYDLEIERNVLKESLRRIEGPFSKPFIPADPDSIANLMENQDRTLEMLREIRRTFSALAQAARKQGKSPTDLLIEMDNNISKVLDDNGNPLAGFNPHPRASRSLRAREFREDFLAYITTIRSNALERKVIASFRTPKKKDGLDATARGNGTNGPLPTLYDELFKPGRKIASDPESPGIGGLGINLSLDTPPPASGSGNGKFDSSHIWNLLDNMSTEANLASRFTKLSNYSSLWRGTAVGTFGTGALGLAGTFLYAGSQGVSITDLAQLGLKVAEKSLTVQRATCIGTLDPNMYSQCKEVYLKTKFLHNYIRELGLRDSSVKGDFKTYEILVDPSSVPSEKKESAQPGVFFKDAASDSIWVRSDFASALPEQQGVEMDHGTKRLRLILRDLPPLGRGFPIERDPTTKKIHIHGQLLNRRKGGMILFSDGKVVFAPEIEKERDEMDLARRIRIINYNDDQVVGYLLRTSPGAGDPCFDDYAQKGLPSKDEALYQRYFMSCVGQRFNILLALSPDGQGSSVSSILKETLEAKSADDRKKGIEKLVQAERNFGNFTCALFQQREKALNDSTTVDYQCDPLYFDPGAFAAYGPAPYYGPGASAPANGNGTWPPPISGGPNQGPPTNTYPPGTYCPPGAYCGPNPYQGGAPGQGVPGPNSGIPGWNSNNKNPYQPPPFNFGSPKQNQ